MVIKSTQKDVIWNYIGIIVSMGSNFLLLPFMMRLVDADHLGLWYVYLSIGAIVTLFDFGFNPTIARNVAYCWSGANELTKEGVQTAVDTEPNYRLLHTVIATCKRIYLYISLAALVILLSAGSAYIFRISWEIRGPTVISSWLIYTFAVFMNLYYGYFATLLRGVGAVSQYNKINVVARVIQIAVSLVLMYCGFGIIGVSVAYLIYGFLLRILSKRVFYQYHGIGKQLLAIHEKARSDEVKKLFLVIWHNAWRDGLVFVAHYCAGQASTLIASNYFSLRETGKYSVAVQLINAIATVAGALYTAYQPAMQSAYATENLKEAKRLMSVAMVTNFTVFCAGVIALETFGIQLLAFIRPDYEFDRLIILGIAIYSFVYKRQSLYSSFISNTNRVPYMPAHIISGIGGILLAIVLLRTFNLGLWGLIIGQLVAQLVYNCWKWPKEVYAMMDTTLTDLVKIGIRDLMSHLKKRDA